LLLRFANCCDYGARSVLLAFLSAGEMLAVPEIAIANDETRNRTEQRHVESLQLCIEVRELVWYLGSAYSFDPFLREIGGPPDQSVATLKTRVLVRRHHHEVIAAGLRNGHRSLPGLVGKCLESALKLAFRHTEHFHPSPHDHVII
jgi:hypothetical protein